MPTETFALCEPERYYVVAELAGILRLSKAKVHQLVNDGSLPALRVGRCIRILGADVNAFVSTHMVVAS